MTMLLSLYAVVSLRLADLQWLHETGRVPWSSRRYGKRGGMEISADTGVFMIGRGERCWVGCSRRWEVGRRVEGKDGRRVVPGAWFLVRVGDIGQWMGSRCISWYVYRTRNGRKVLL